jgi:hypothetical protein
VSGANLGGVVFGAGCDKFSRFLSELRMIFATTVCVILSISLSSAPEDSAATCTEEPHPMVPYTTHEATHEA